MQWFAWSEKRAAGRLRLPHFAPGLIACEFSRQVPSKLTVDIIAIYD
jgi:hypothetical protein